MKLIYIGSDFYSKSGTMMSPIYEVNESGIPTRRMDWGFVEIALKDGQEIHIVQATSEQMLWAYKTLERWEQRYADNR